jgi:hypothetical protein
MHHARTPTDLPDLWRALAVQQRSLGAEAQARTLEFCADHLTATVLHMTDELLSLHSAAQESGYNVDHLGRLLREGKIPNSGRKAKPLIRRRDLPAKTGKRKAKSCTVQQADYISDRLFRDIIHSKYGGDDAQE